MNLMLVPLPKKIEYTIRDAIINELRTKSMDEVVNELYTNFTTIQENDSLYTKRFKSLHTKIHTQKELESIIRLFINNLNINATTIPNKGEIANTGNCEILCMILIAVGCGIATGVTANLLQDWWNDDDDCPAKCAKVIPFTMPFGGDEVCYELCVDSDGTVIDEWEVPCEGGSQHN